MRSGHCLKHPVKSQPRFVGRQPSSAMPAGVPHIEASSWQDAIFLQGYVTAQDRLWQMDGLRRFSAGELAEIFGPALVATDERSTKNANTGDCGSRCASSQSTLSVTVLASMRAESITSSTHIEGNYSLEFSLPGHAYDPRPWSVTDSVLVGLAMFRDLTDSSRFELSKGKLLAIADPAKAKLLFPAIEGQFVSVGSNAWAVSGAHTADGKPMAANDPHLAYGIPGTWHLVHLKAPGLNVSGAALPGVPCVITGHNEQIAWGVTNLSADVLDLYAEQMDERTGRYLFRGNIEQAQARPPDDSGEGRQAGSGGYLGDATWAGDCDLKAARPTACDGARWMALAFRSSTSTERRIGSSFERRSAAIGDRGRISFTRTERGISDIKRQGGCQSGVALMETCRLDGASGSSEWDGYIPFEQMPSVYNPASGIIASANQNPFPPDFAYRVEGNFADRYRVEQIRALLGEKRRLTVRDMLAVQKDVYSAYDHFLAQQMIAACRTRGSNEQRVREAVEILRRWNGQMEKDQAAPMITELLSREIGQELVQSSATYICARQTCPISGRGRR